EGLDPCFVLMTCAEMPLLRLCEGEGRSESRDETLEAGEWLYGAYRTRRESRFLKGNDRRHTARGATRRNSSKANNSLAIDQNESKLEGKADTKRWIVAAKYGVAGSTGSACGTNRNEMKLETRASERSRTFYY